ncbi:amino acid ABC transporter substrate-binding protein, PAAT family (TC 3.A.1.3.-) [Roseibium hamelinense]|uniref:Amino acid ABC transporter substrate-binding protein, PAAT family (TC 3.A.1.3.-) n=1 Tax=Roseibium hamelinense TaxID=150831 RepID=A0A562SYP6_9HYPH|nr:transporter substrate-binding domain-containing protein [Roseibium hamelinense]MTI43671.1 transporter substrate-binding domain-containing protein [Roseibium hamelinense]TWI86188.1 amino acid ABC transporter substrate-binding protein, PAAT family (TC 3.A.1.3.-) [Roseibium hamelinense]
MRRLSVVSAAFFSLTAVTASAEDYKLTTLEWPPYVMADGSGASTDAVKSAFEKAGSTAEVEVFPWNRAINLAQKDAAWIGVYPEYYAEGSDAEKGGDRCLFSNSFGTSPVGFIQRKDNDFSWSSHDDLKSYTIGIVRGYQNEEQFDAMVAEGAIPVEEADDDAQNILKVAGKRSDAAVIDRLVFEHLAKADDEVAAVADQLVFNDKLLIEHGLHVCFENTDAGRAVRDAFNSSL